uniref:FAD/NAD(P)-binding domain-containing protein n=1 Tax=Parascaris equorum TaxID=6256 RepID=A0A914RPK4_PAREQ
MADTLEYKGLSGKKKDVYYETHGFYVPPEEVNDAQHGGVSLLMGHRGVPRNLAVFEEAGEKVNEKVTLFRTIDDFRKLDKVAKQSRSLTIVGGGFLGSELAYSLNKRFASNGLKVTQIISEKGNVAEVLPEFLSEYTSKELRKCGVN